MSKSASTAVTVEMLTQTTLKDGCIPHYDRVDWIDVSVSPPVGFRCAPDYMGGIEIQDVPWFEFVNGSTGCIDSKTTNGRIICYQSTGAVSGPSIHMTDGIRLNSITVHYK